MRIISINVNGLRAALKKGFFAWLEQQAADIVCVQEIRAHPDQLSDHRFWPSGYHCHYFPAQKKGYSGVGVYCQAKPTAINQGFGVEEFDNEGRYIELRFSRLSLVCLYAPSGSANEQRQASKDRFLAVFPRQLNKLKKSGRQVVVCGDFNIAHRQIDLKNWKANQQHSGFLAHERAWMDQLLNTEYVDAYRVVEPHTEQYTWWSNRGLARENNVGWRIDYQIVTSNLAACVKAARVYTDEWFSDHAPLIIDYDFALTS